MSNIAIKDRRAVPDTTVIAPLTPATGPAETFLLALRSGATVEEAERVGEMLLRFQEREEARDAERAFNAAFAQAMTEMPAIPKDTKATRINSQTGKNAGSFWYSKLETILGKAQPVLGRHGLHLGFSVSSAGDGKSVRVAAIVRHSGGHSIREELASPIVSFGSANTSLQNQEGTVTALKRTLAMSILGLAVGGEEEAVPYVAQDGPADAPADAPITAEQFLELNRLVEEAQADVPKLQRFFDVEHLEHLTHRQFLQAVQMLRTKVKQAAGGAADAA